MPDTPKPKKRPHPWKQSTPPSCLPYCELSLTTNFTFLTGASHPEEFAVRAAELGYGAIAVTDINTLAGIVRAHVAAREAGVCLVVGCQLVFTADCPSAPSCLRAPDAVGVPSCLPEEGRGSGVEGRGLESNKSFSSPSSLRRPDSVGIASSLPSPPSCLSILVYPTDLASYGRLCRLLTIGRRRAPKGHCHLHLHDLIEHGEGMLAVVVPPAVLDQDFIDLLLGLRSVFDDDRLSIAVSQLYGPDDQTRLRQLQAMADHTGVPLVATNAVHYHEPGRRALQDVLTCIRLGCTLDEAGLALFPNGERYLKPPDEMASLFTDCPAALARGVEIAERASGFSLDQLRYQYPHEICPPGVAPMQHLIDLTRQSAAQRYPQGVPGKVRSQLEHEFELIEELNYAPYFLTVHDLVVFARSRGILCQGRGAAANSAVCYCLGITSVDPDRIDVLFERFVSKQRSEPPDIDIDFEHERREEVIQYIYRKYGRDRAALTAEVITYRGRSAVREVGKALGLSLDCVDRLAKNLDWWDRGALHPQRLRELGLDPADPTIRRLGTLAGQILGFPRHLSQHVGGFVITRPPLCELVPIENAAMEDRTVIEWDKDDIDAMGMLKVDVLGLGMLTCIRKCFELVNEEATKGNTANRNPYFKEFGHDQEFSRSDCVAAGDGIGSSGVQGDGQDAGIGTVLPDRSDAACRGVDPIEHRGRTWPPGQEGLPEAPSDRPGVTGGTFHPTRTVHQPQTDPTRPAPDGSDRRRGSHSPGPDPQPETKVNPPDQNDALSSPSSLRRGACPDSVGVASSLQLHSIPPEAPRVYDMICAADTVGVFQIESRAQMSMLPRLRPRCFYDLVIEVAIVRPGPIHGNMVHPYLRRRNGEEPVTYPSEDVKEVLAKTLGVPLFQEQAMRLAIVAAGFTPEEADRLRRAIAAWKSRQQAVMNFGDRLINGMTERGYPRAFAERCFKQIQGFSEYGFPESHAASFALLVYVSAWLKCYHPAAFAAALINSQPMGFYAPAQIIRDAREHGVEVRPIDVHHSGWECGLEEGRHEGGEGGEGNDGATPKESGRRSDEEVPIRAPLLADRSLTSASPALRLGMRLIKGMRQEEAETIAAAVARHPDPSGFDSVQALWRASGVRASALKRLASADAFRSMGLDRQAALWQVKALHDEALPLLEKRHEGGSDEEEHALRSPLFAPRSSPPPAFSFLPAISEPRKVMQDYVTTGLSLRGHPVSFIRNRLDKAGVTPAIELKDEDQWPHGSSIAVAGIVLVRQRPGTASGIVFMTLEDETAVSNLIVRSQVFERCRKAARHGVVIIARGRVERRGQVVHILAHRLKDISDQVRELAAASRNFH